MLARSCVLTLAQTHALVEPQVRTKLVPGPGARTASRVPGRLSPGARMLEPEPEFVPVYQMPEQNVATSAAFRGVLLSLSLRTYSTDVQATILVQLDCKMVGRIVRLSGSFAR